MLCPNCLADNADNLQICATCGSPLFNTDADQTNSLTTSLHNLPPGALLKQGQYTIERVLGEGGFGITYKAYNTVNKTLVAIKELWPERAARQGTVCLWPNSITPQQKQEQINKFKVEGANQQKCVHPNIAKVHEWFEQNNTVYIVMEFVAGESLFSIIKKQKRLTENIVISYFIKIVEALKVVHNQGLLHRDLKPENILINDHHQPVLIDFGATREFLAGQTQDHTRILTPGYAPPEQYITSAKRCPATDIYALCASMYETLTGQLPVDSISRSQSPQSDPLIPPRQLCPEISELIEMVLLTGMKIKVEDRFQNTDELIAALKGKFISPLLRKAQKLVQENKLLDSVQVYDQYLLTNPHHGEAAVELALVQIHLDDTQAERAAQRAIQLNPNDGRGYGVLGLVACRRENWAEAVINLEKAASLNANQAWIQANLSWALAKSGDWQQAEISINQALKLDPNSSFILGVRAWIAFQRQQYKPTVIQAATQAIFKSKQNYSPISQELQYWTYPYLISALDKVNSQDLARRIAECLQQHPDHPFAWGYKGMRHAKDKQWLEAISCLQKAAQHPQVPNWVILNLAVIHELQNNLSQAIQAYEICRQKISGDAFIYYRLGTLLACTGKWEQAQTYLQQAIQLNPNYAEAYHNLGWTLKGLSAQGSQGQLVRELVSNYRQAIFLYTQNHNQKYVQQLKQAFQKINIQL